jgi:hypothetical protein
MSVMVVCTIQFADSFKDGQGLPQRCGVSTFESTVHSECATYSEPCVLPTKRVCVFRVTLSDVCITRLKFAMEMKKVVMKHSIF